MDPNEKFEIGIKKHREGVWFSHLTDPDEKRGWKYADDEEYESKASHRSAMRICLGIF